MKGWALGVFITYAILQSVCILMLVARDEREHDNCLPVNAGAKHYCFVSVAP